MSSSGVIVRASSPADIEQISEIYAWNVLNETGTFEITPPSPAEMAQRREDVLSNGLPWIVAESRATAESAAVLLGYAYANQFRPRPAYRFCAEDSIYLSSDATGRGIGRMLLSELIAQCEARGIRQMIAVIGDANNAASIALHRALGFEHTGVLRSSGRKFDRWLDVVLMQRALGTGDTDTPIERASGSNVNKNNDNDNDNDNDSTR